MSCCIFIFQINAYILNNLYLIWSDSVFAIVLVFPVSMRKHLIVNLYGSVLSISVCGQSHLQSSHLACYFWSWKTASAPDRSTFCLVNSTPVWLMKIPNSDLWQRILLHPRQTEDKKKQNSHILVALRKLSIYLACNNNYESPVGNHAGVFFYYQTSWLLGSRFGNDQNQTEKTWTRLITWWSTAIIR